MKASNRIWGTAAILVLAIIGCAAGVVILSNHEAKIEIRKKRIANIDSAIRYALSTAKEALNRRLLDEEVSSSSGIPKTVDAKLVRQLLEKQTRRFNFCEEEVSTLNNRRGENEAAAFGLMEAANESTILTVVCAVLGLYAAFWMQRYT